MRRQTYESLDAFQLDDGRVMVTLGVPGHRIPEEFVPLAEIKRLREVLTDAQRSLEAASTDHDCEWCGDCAYNIQVALRAKETG